MASDITEKVIQAYESILEQSKLEAYFRYHLSPNKKGEEEEDIQEEEGESSEAGSSNPEAEIEGTNEPEDGASWSANEIDLFFISLERRSRVRCDLIAKDLGGCKSISQIAHLIHLFEQEKGDQEKHEAKKNPIRRMKDVPIAIEVSKEWEKIEEAIASKLQLWEEVKHKKLGAGEAAPHVECDWDTQVMYSILFLRHTHHLDPLQNTANLVVKKSSSLVEESRVFSFTISDVVDILHDSRLANKLDTRAFWSFANDHYVPYIDSDKKAWYIILRSIQLNYLVPLNATGGKKKDHGQFRASLDEQLDLNELTIKFIQKSPKQRLVWWDSLPKTENSETLTERLDDTRELALHQLLRSLKRKEYRQIMAMIKVEKERNLGTKHHLAEDDVNENRPSKRRKITTGEGAEIAGKVKWEERMVRFDRIGIHENDLLNCLEPHFSFEEQTLFRAKWKADKLKHDSSLGRRISLHIFDLLAVCLRIFLHRILEHITNQISHPLRPDNKHFVVEITGDDIVRAIDVVSRTTDLDSELSNLEMELNLEEQSLKKVKIKSKGEIKPKFINEIKEIIRLEGVGKEDRKRSKMAEQLLWSRLDLNVPDTLSYFGRDEDETEEEDEEEEESENESSSSSSGSEWILY